MNNIPGDLLLLKSIMIWMADRYKMTRNIMIDKVVASITKQVKTPLRKLSTLPD